MVVPGYNEHDPVFLTNESRVMRGVRRLVPVTTPAAGQDWQLTVPGGRMWRVLGGSAKFVTSAVVANRFVGVQLLSGGLPLYVAANSTAVVASTTATLFYQQMPGAVTSNTFGTRWFVPITLAWLEPGDSIGSLSVSTDAGDQYSQIGVAVEEAFFDPNLLAELAYREARARDAATT